MSKRHVSRITLCALVIILVSLPPGRAIAQQDPIVQLLSSINGTRISSGLPPFALDTTLTISAQRHSDDMAAHDFIDHTGSDDSTYKERMAAAGYPAYSNGILGTELVFGGVGGPEEPFDWWMSSPAHRELVLSTQYREIGIGMARRPADEVTYWTLNLGARPNVLPIFINYGAPQTDDRNVVLTLSNEGGMINGDGPEVIGLATEVRVANGADFTTWQPWEAEMAWVLPAGEGEKMVYVEFRDRDGRTTISQASIHLVGDSLVPTPQPTMGALPTASSSPPSTVPDPGATVAPSIPPTSIVVYPTAAYSLTLYPHTSTPPHSPRPIPITHWLTFRPEDVLPFACGLQAVAALLGFILVARRQRPS